MIKHSGFCSAHRDGEDKECGICYPKKESVMDWKVLELMAKTKQLPRKYQIIIQIIICFMSGSHIFENEWKTLQQEYKSYED